MKPWKQIGLWPAIGLVIEDKRISLSVVATTPGGRKEVTRDSQSCEGEPPESILERTLEPWLGTRQDPRQKKPSKARREYRPWVQIAVPESKVFQAVVPITGANRSAAPEALFMEAVQATNLRAEERMIDLIKLELNKHPLACLAASPRVFITGLIETLKGLGTRVAMIEPAPAGLFRAGVFHKKTPRGSKLCIRFFLGRTQAIGILAADMQPLFWHTFDLPADDVTAAILATYSMLWMQGRHNRISLPIDTVIVQGRPDLKLSLKPEEFRERTGAQLIRFDKPDYESASAALGTALANPLTEATGLDLARGVKPVAPIREIIPWGELVLQGALVAGVSMFLHAGDVELDTQLKETQVEMGTLPWIKDQDQTKLQTEKKLLEDRFKALESFQGSRVDWSAQLRTIAGDMPESTLVTSFQGTGGIKDREQSSSTNQMIVNFTTPLANDGAIPPEINDLITALRAEPALTRYFPVINVSGLQASPSQGKQSPSVSYSVVCTPATKDKGSGPKKAAAR
jgi:hypothetical protein